MKRIKFPQVFACFAFAGGIIFAPLLLIGAEKPEAKKSPPKTATTQVDAQQLETIWTRTTGDFRARAMSIVEFICPTEGTPPEVPDQLKLEGVPPADFHGTSQSSTAFETRDVGPQIDVDASPGPEREWMNLLFTLEYHEEAKIDYYTPDDDTDSEMKNRWMPAFHKVHVSTTLVMKDDSWAVAGMHTPPGDESKRVVALIRASVLK